MKKKTLLVALLLMAVGFAAVSTTLLINGTSIIKKNTDDFRVYYSSAKVNGVENGSVVVDDTHLSFKTTLDKLGQTYVLDYDVTNSSKNYDAKLTMNCTGGNEWLTVVNIFNTTDNLLATDTRSGKLTLTLAKSYTGDDLDVEIECSIGANAVERNSMATGIPKDPIEKICYQQLNILSGNGETPGDIISLCDEKFYVLESDDSSVKLLSYYNVDKELNRQSETAKLEKFNNGVGYYSGSELEDRVNNYGIYLESIGFENTVTIVGLSDLEKYGCVYERSEYYFSCPDTLPEWYANGKYWTNVTFSGSTIVSMYDGEARVFEDKSGTRPVVIISKELLEV